MMRREGRLRSLTAGPTALLLLSVAAAIAQEPGPSAPDFIPEGEIAALEAALDRADGTSSRPRKRRTLKGLVRDGEALLAAAPDAPHRFRVLEIVFRSQKRLLGIESSDRNREALLDTCARLAAAPDELANLRVEADMLLSERELSRRNADVKERTEALAALIARYRGTPGEAKSLMMASLIAPKLEAFELEKEIFRSLDERFAGDYDVIEWRRKHHGYAHERVLFSGTYGRPGGAPLVFPIDGIGHTCLMVFWSGTTPEIAGRLAAIEDLRSRFPDRLDVLSFNVDESADGGSRALEAMGLDWTAMLLPGGRRSQTYRVVARQDPIAVRANAHGHAFLPSTLIDSLTDEMSMEQNLDDSRYLAQLRSLLVGDFLVAAGDAVEDANDDDDDDAARAGTRVPARTLEAIQECFVMAPLRYRLTPEEALESYRRAEQLCRGALARHPGATDLWRVRNRRIVARMGMWKLALEPEHLEAAVAEARLALAASPPRGADVPARFCLARAALREGTRAPRLVLADLIEATGADRAPPSADAAAAILAMDVSSAELHATHREKLLASHGDDPALWPVVTFLLDQNHTFRLFKANYYMPPSLARRIVRARLRSNAASLDRSPGLHGPLEADFDTLTGGKLSLPRTTDDKLTLLMFVEPPADPNAEFPTAVNGATGEDSRGRTVQTKGAMQRAFELAGEHVCGRLQVIAAFLSEDRPRVRALVERLQWPCRSVLVPGGLESPVVRRLGILSADRVPNIVLLRPDGTIAWRLSGIVHPQLRSEGIGETLHVIQRAMRANIHALEMEDALRAFEEGDLEEAVRLFSGPFPFPEKPRPDEWTAPRLHGRALCHMALEHPEAALADIEAAIEAHQWVFNAKKPCVCRCVARLKLTRATLLAGLGRAQEAEEARREAAAANRSHGATRAGRLHERLESLHRAGSREP